MNRQRNIYKTKNLIVHKSIINMQAFFALLLGFIVLPNLVSSFTCKRTFTSPLTFTTNSRILTNKSSRVKLLPSFIPTIHNIDTCTKCISTKSQIGYSSLPYQEDEDFKKQLKDFQGFITPTPATADITPISSPKTSLEHGNSNSILEGPTQISQTQETFHETSATDVSSSTAATSTASTKPTKPKKSRVTKRSPVPKLPNVHVVKSLDEFQCAMEQNRNQLIVVRFYATWCKVCFQMLRIFLIISLI